MVVSKILAVTRHISSAPRWWVLAEWQQRAELVLSIVAKPHSICSSHAVSQIYARAEYASKWQSSLPKEGSHERIDKTRMVFFNWLSKFALRGGQHKAPRGVKHEVYVIVAQLVASLLK